MCADDRCIVVASVRSVLYIQASLSCNIVTLNAAQQFSTFAREHRTNYKLEHTFEVWLKAFACCNLLTHGHLVVIEMEGILGVGPQHVLLIGNDLGSA